MLKPKKNITKKEIQIDPLLETIDKFQAKVENNKQFYSKIVIGLLSLVILISFLIRNYHLNNNEADTSLGIALISIDKGDYNTATFQLETIINEFESTFSADLATFYLGKIKYINNEIELAQQYISTYLSSNSSKLMNAAASKIMADIHFRKNNLSKSINIIDLSLKNCSNSFNCNSLKIKKAFYLIKQGDVDVANTLLLELKNQKDIDLSHKRATEELMGEIAG